MSSWPPGNHQDVTDAVTALQTAVADLPTNSNVDSSIAGATTTLPTPIYLQHSGSGTALSGYPVRPNTSRPCHWFGPAAASLPLTGTTSGGTRAAVPGLDIVSEY